MRTRNPPSTPHKIARLANQRVRLLPRHALERSARHRRNRTATVRSRRLARVTLLHRPRTRRPGLDRSRHTRHRRPRPGPHIRRSPSTFHGKRIGRPYSSHRHHQCLEPDRYCLPRNPRKLPAPNENSRSQKNRLIKCFSETATDISVGGFFFLAAGGAIFFG